MYLHAPGFWVPWYSTGYFCTLPLAGRAAETLARTHAHPWLIPGFMLALAYAASSAQLLVVQCGGTNDRFGRLHIDVGPRLQATIELAAAATANHKMVRVLTSGGLNETLHLGIARGPGPFLTRPHWRLVADALLECALPKAALLEEGLPALTTVDEAIMTHEYILRAQSQQQQGKPLSFTEVAVITSAYHRPRVEHLFSRALAPCTGVQVKLRVVTVPEGRRVAEAGAPKYSLLDTQANRMREAHEAAALAQLRTAPNGKWLTFLEVHGGTECTPSPINWHHAPHRKVERSPTAVYAPGHAAKAATVAAEAPAAEAQSDADVARGRRWAVLCVLAAFALVPLSVGFSLLCRWLDLVYRPEAAAIVVSRVPLIDDSSMDADSSMSARRGKGTRFLFTAVIVCAFITLNSALSLVNRWGLGVVGGLHLPLIMTASHMIFGAFVLAPLMILHDGYACTLLDEARSHSRVLVAVGVMNALQIGMNNASLVSIELSLNQVIRATGPVVTSCILICLEGTVPSRAEALCLLMISGGAATTLYSGIGASTAFGVLLTASSTLTQCMQISMSGRLMRGRGKLDTFQMTVLTGPISFLAILPFGLATEFGTLSTALATQPAKVLGFLLGTSVLATGYNVTLFQALATLSTTGTSILGNVKIVLLLFLSALFLGELRSWSTSQLLGCALTFMASGYYSNLKLNRSSGA